MEVQEVKTRKNKVDEDCLQKVEWYKNVKVEGGSLGKDEIEESEEWFGGSRSKHKICAILNIL